jgi:hypothetical protein
MPPKMTTMVPIAQLASLVEAQIFFQRAGDDSGTIFMRA